MNAPIFSKTVTLIFELDLKKVTLTLVLKRMFYPKEYVKHESSITYLSKAMANVKVSVDKPTDRWTNKTGKKLYAPDLSMWGHKKNNLLQEHNKNLEPSL